jgi:Putative addiction module component
MVFTLPKAQRVRLADELLEDSIVPFRDPVTLETLERRAKELHSGKVKGVSDKEFDATLRELEMSIEANS